MRPVPVVFLRLAFMPQLSVGNELDHSWGDVGAEEEE